MHDAKWIFLTAFAFIALLCGEVHAEQPAAATLPRAVPQTPYRPDPSAFVSSGRSHPVQQAAASEPLPEVIHGPLPTSTPAVAVSQSTAPTTPGPGLQPPPDVQGNPWARTAAVPPPATPTDAEPASREGEPVPPEATDQAEPSEIEALKQQIQHDTTLDDDARKAALDLVGQIEQSTQSAARQQERIAKFEAEIAQVPDRLEDLRQAIAEPDFDPREPIAATATAADAQALLTEAKAALTEAEQGLESVKKRLDIHRRKKEIETRRAEISQQLEKLQSEPTAGESTGRLAELQRRAMESLVAALEVEQQSHPVELRRLDEMERVWRSERDLAERDVRYWTERSEFLSTQFNKLREAETQQEVARSQQRAAEIHPSFKAWADSNAHLAGKRTELTHLISEVEAKQARYRDTTDSINTYFDKIRRKVEVAGHTSTVGLLLRRLRTDLPEQPTLRKEVAGLETEMTRVELQKLEMDEQRSQLGNIPELVDQVLAQVDEPVLVASGFDAREVARHLVQQNRDYLEDLIDDQNTYIERLSGLEDVLRVLLLRRDKIASYIDEQVLWIRSAEPLTPDQFDGTIGLINLLLDARHSQALSKELSNVIGKQPYSSLLMLLLVAGLIGYRGPIRERLMTACQSTERDLKKTFAALGWAALLASKWAPAMLWLGWSLSRSARTGDLAQAIGSGMLLAGSYLWLMCWLRTMCLPEGLAERHFGWSTDFARLFRRWTMEMILVGGLLAFFGGMLSRVQNGAWADSWGRATFIVTMLWIAWLVVRQLRWVNQTLSSSSATVLSRTRGYWQPLLVGLPILLATLAAVGYYYSATQLASRLLWTGCLAVTVAIVHGIGFRLATVLRGRMAQQASSPFTILRGRKTGDGERFDVAAFHAHVLRTLRATVATVLLVGSFFVWAPVLPALQVLDRVNLWSTSATTVVASSPGITAAAEGDGETAISPVVTVEYVSLSDLLLAVALVVLTVMLGRSLPALLEVIVLNRLPIDRGGRHALAVIVRYVITTVGVCIACNLIGLTWSSVQWLVAAMTVGLGFGLQEIFANFVSGLIILFEQPIRVGDLVTVGGVTGNVTQTRIRATTITDFDRRELIVPNKRFITDDVINWTLSDNVSRVVVPVGIAYGSDTQRAHDVLLEVAQQHPNVMSEPAPSAVFKGFGDSTLNYELRIFIPSRDVFPKVQHDMHMQIDRAFREAGIEIAFPQCDIHVRAAAGLPAVLQPPGDRRAA